MEPWEDDLFDLLLLVPLGDDVAAEDFQPAFACPNLFPEIRRAVAALRIDRVASRAVIALVEGQKHRGWPFQLRYHRYFAVAYREMHQRTVGKRQQRLGGLALRTRQTVKAILVNGVGNALGKIGLQFDGSHGARR